MDVRKELWVARGGSIFTEKSFKAKTIQGNAMADQPATIAFNVGNKVAERIVLLHNTALAKELE